MTKKQIQDWHEEGVGLARTYLKCEARMVELLSLLARTRGYLFFESPSLRAYAITQWGLPEFTAADMVTVARKSLEIPELLAALQRGNSSLNKLRRICSVITPEDKTEWIELAEKATSREVEKAIATARPQAVDESLTYRDDDLVELRTGVSEKTLRELERIRDLLSQKRGRQVSLAECLELMTEITLNKLDPVKKAERAMRRNVARQEKDGTRQTTKRASSRPKRLAHVDHAVTLRDQGQCTHQEANGKRCLNRRYLHSHHLIPVAHGGSDSVDNLTSLCSGHHRLVHFQENHVRH